MATFSKPASVARWASNLANVLEPPSGQKDTGWLFEQIPPSQFENWRANITGSWQQWLNERMDDGVTNDTLEFLSTVVKVDNGFVVGSAAVPGIGEAIFGGEITSGGGGAAVIGGTSQFLSQGVNIGVPANNAIAGQLFTAGGVRIGSALTGSPANGELFIQDGLRAGSSVVSAVGDGDGLFEGGLVVGFDQAPVAKAIYVGDASFLFDGSNAAAPTIFFDALDGLQYTRAVNQFDFVVAGTSIVNVIENAGLQTLRPTSSGNTDCGRPSQHWRSVHSTRFVPQTTYNVPVESRWEFAQNNSIAARGHFDGIGTVTIIGGHWNIDAISSPGTGEFLITLDTNLGANGHTLSSVETFLSPVKVCSSEWDNSAGEIQVRIMTLAGALFDDDFSVIGFG